MTPGRIKSPGRFPPIAMFTLGFVVLAALAGIEFGLIDSPFGGDEAPMPVAEAKPRRGVPADVIRRPEPKPSASASGGARAGVPSVVVHDEEADEPPAPLKPPRPAPGEKPKPAEAKPGGGKDAKPWRERLALLHRRLHNRGVDAASVARKAMDELDAITDPGAAPMLWHVFAGHAQHHSMVARQLARLESPRSSLLLAALAAYTPDEKAMRAAVDGLKARDPVEYAGPLIALLGPELKYRMGTLPTEPGGPALQALEIEDERCIKQFVYFAGTTPDEPSPWAFGGCPAMPGERDLAKAALTQELADAQLQSDIAAVDDLNRRIRAMNARVRAILAEATGQDHRLDRDAWYGWLASKTGKAYVPPERLAKVQLREFVEPIYQPTFVEVPPVPS